MGNVQGNAHGIDERETIAGVRTDSGDSTTNTGNHAIGAGFSEGMDGNGINGGDVLDNGEDKDIGLKNRLTIFWDGRDGLGSCDVWAWWDGQAGCGYRLTPCEYGAVCTIAIPKGVDRVGFIVRTNCSDPCKSSWGTAYKDWHDDRTATIRGADTTIYLRSGDGNQYVSDDGGRTLNPIRVFSFAEMIDRNRVRCHVNPATMVTSSSQIHVRDDGGREIKIGSLDPTGHEAMLGVVTLAEDLDISRRYTIEIQGYGEKEIVPTHVFDTQWFGDNFTYNGDDLGSSCTEEGTTFKVWAPTAQNVDVNLFRDGHTQSLIATYPMEKGDKGVWSATLPSSVCGHGTYYTYTATTAVGTQEAVDPYAKALGVNGDRGMVVDLGSTDPNGWNDDRYVDTVETYSDAIIWEVHVRDFSNKDSMSKYPGKYLAFTETGHTVAIDAPCSPGKEYGSNEHDRTSSAYSPVTTGETACGSGATENNAGGTAECTVEGPTCGSDTKGGATEGTTHSTANVPIGMDHLTSLGVTHVQLNPVFDFATVDESSDKPQFNWGYDPKNFNAPEGSYSTDPYHGEVRIHEFKRMVQALHSRGLGVVMDVVYNHTYDANSCLNRLVPYYYYRYNFNGTNSNGSGCGNETASQRAMFRKFMVDSIRYWATEYHIDGFRFDLMAIHDTTTMQAIENTLHGINPKALIYGEGWAGGTCALDPSKLASMANIGQVTASQYPDGSRAIGSIAVFNDIIRDGLKGNVFEVQSRGYINGGQCHDNANKVCFGLKGGVGTHGIYWEAKDAMVVNYMSSHDNNTLWDKLKLSNINATTEELLAMNRLGAACVLLSRGMPFMLAGEELLRSKNGDGNSYNSSDEINNIDWERLARDPNALAMAQWYRDLIALRKAYPFIGNAHVTCNILDGNVIEALYHYNGSLAGYALFNPNDHQVHHSLPHGPWKLLLDGRQFVLGSRTVEGKANVQPKGVLLIAR